MSKDIVYRRTGSVDPTEESLPALVNKSKFRRYHVPPEVFPRC